MLNLQIGNEYLFCLETGKCSSLEDVVQRCANLENKLEHVPNFKQNDFFKKHRNQQFFGLQDNCEKINFMALSLIIIIGFYLLGCTIAL